MHHAEGSLGKVPVVTRRQDHLALQKSHCVSTHKVYFLLTAEGNRTRFKLCGRELHPIEGYVELDRDRRTASLEPLPCKGQSLTMPEQFRVLRKVLDLASNHDLRHIPSKIKL